MCVIDSGVESVGGVGCVGLAELRLAGSDWLTEPFDGRSMVGEFPRWRR